MRKLYFTLAVLAAAALALPGAAQAQANKLTVGMPTTPPNVVHMPVVVAIDLGLYKNTTLFEKVKFQFRAEFFNVFNHTNFALPDNLVVFTSEQSTVPANFGRVTRTTSTSRQIQLGMKFIF